MSRTLLWRLVALVLPLLTGLLGAFNGPEAFRVATTGGQRIAAGTQTAYGILGLTSTIGLAQGRIWARQALIAWAILLTITGGMAPVIWGATGVGSGLLALVATAVIAAGGVWLGWRTLRGVR
jgi:hypothetical protein